MFIDLVQDDLFVNLHHGTTLPDINRTRYIIRHNRNGPDNIPDQGSPFDRIIPGIGQQQLRLEADKIGFVLTDKFSKLGRAVRTGK